MQKHRVILGKVKSAHRPARVQWAAARTGCAVVEGACGARGCCVAAAAGRMAKPYRVVRATKDDRSFIEIAALDNVALRDAGGNYRHDEDHSDGGECGSARLCYQGCPPTRPA